MSFANFVTEGYGKDEEYGKEEDKDEEGDDEEEMKEGYGKMEDEEEDKKEEGYGKMEDEEEDEEGVKEKYDKVTLGGNKGDKSKTHDGEDYEKDEEEEEGKVKESKVTEKEIKSDGEFSEYATEILKSAHGDKFDEAKAKEVIDGLLSKYKGDYGAMVGALQSTMGS